MSRTTNLTALGLHTGRDNTLCSCGACQHRLRIIANRLGITVDQLREMLNVSPATAGAAPARRQVNRGVQVAERATVTVGGQQYTGTAAILAAVRALT